VNPKVFRDQLVADVYQAIARAGLDVFATNAVLRQFQQIRQGRGELPQGIVQTRKHRRPSRFVPPRQYRDPVMQIGSA
jgi:hypothetical protein